MIALPLAPENTLLPNVLQSISGNYDVVWSYNASSGSWHNSNGDLTDIDHKIGMWIYMSVPDELVTVGGVEMTTTIQLHDGWNLVGYDYHFGLTSIDDALLGLPYTAVQWYDSFDTVDKWKNNTIRPDKDNIYQIPVGLEKYSRKNLTKDLKNILEKLQH